MDSKGNLYTEEELDAIPKDKRPRVIQIDPKHLTQQAIRQHKVGRNDPCPCGSGKKFKKCHLGFED